MQIILYLINYKLGDNNVGPTPDCRGGENHNFAFNFLEWTWPQRLEEEEVWFNINTISTIYTIFAIYTIYTIYKIYTIYTIDTIYTKKYNTYNISNIHKICNCMHFLSKVEEFMAEADIDQNGKLDYDEFSRMLLREPSCDNWCIQIYKNVLWSVIYRVSLKKGSFRPIL